MQRRIASSRWMPQQVPGGGMLLPEPTERFAQTGQGEAHAPQVRPGAMAIGAQAPDAHLLPGLHQAEQKIVSQRGQQQQLFSL